MPETILINREDWQAEVSQNVTPSDGGALPNLLKPLSLEGLDDQELAYHTLKDLIYYREYDDKDLEALSNHVDNVMSTARAPRDTQPLNFSTLIMTDPTVRNYLATRDLNQAQEELLRIWPSLSDTFRSGVESAINLGYAPAGAARRLTATLALTKIGIADNAIFEGLGEGGYDSAKDEVLLSHELADEEDAYQILLVHELKHKISGGTFVANLGENRDIISVVRPRIGYATELSPGKVKRAGLNEAVAEHMTVGILSGDFETFDPDERDDYNQSDYVYRKIVAAFIAKSGGLLEVKTLTNAFYGDDREEGTFDGRKKLIASATAAYGRGALNKLEKLIVFTESFFPEVAYSEMIDPNRLESIVLSRIHAAEVGTDGSVIRRGDIDVDNFPTHAEL